jgi:hypothetical protein
LDTLIEADKDASESFKRDFDGREIALEVIKGKSKNFNKMYPVNGNVERSNCQDLKQNGNINPKLMSQ